MRLTVIILGLLLILSCEKEEGPGGRSSVAGKLMVKEYNKDFSLLLSQHPAHNHDIYINYGNEDVIGDDMETSQEGKFRFFYLQPGKYVLWYHSDDTLPGSNGDMIMEHKIKLKKKQGKNLGTLFTYKTKAFDEGSASICGKVYLINYKNTAVPPYEESDIKDITPAQEEDVYLIYNDHSTPDESEETNYNGEYCFKNLIKGKYMIFVYSEDLPGGEYDFNSDNVIVNENSQGTYDLVVFQNVKITETRQNIRLDDFYIEQE
jgi:hypothetical protein